MPESRAPHPGLAELLVRRDAQAPAEDLRQRALKRLAARGVRPKQVFLHPGQQIDLERCPRAQRRVLNVRPQMPQTGWRVDGVRQRTVGNARLSGGLRGGLLAARRDVPGEIRVADPAGGFGVVALNVLAEGVDHAEAEHGGREAGQRGGTHGGDARCQVPRIGGPGQLHDPDPVGPQVVVGHRHAGGRCATRASMNARSSWSLL